MVPTMKLQGFIQPRLKTFLFSNLFSMPGTRIIVKVHLSMYKVPFFILNRVVTFVAPLLISFGLEKTAQETAYFCSGAAVGPSSWELRSQDGERATHNQSQAGKAFPTPPTQPNATSQLGKHLQLSSSGSLQQNRHHASALAIGFPHSDCLGQLFFPGWVGLRQPGGVAEVGCLGNCPHPLWLVSGLDK